MERPDIYLTSNNLQRSGVRDFSEEFVNEISEMSGCCLDVGSGPGDTVVDIILPKLSPNAKLICSDISENMVNFGKEIYKDNERVSYIKLDIESPYLPENLTNHFSHVTSFFCIHWCQDMYQVFGNIFKLLQPGGTALLSFIANHFIYDVYTILAAMPQYQSYMEDVDRYVPAFQHVEDRSETLKTLISSIGFEVHHCSLREKTHIFETPETFEKFVLALNPFTKRMPVDLGEEYKRDLVKEVTRRSAKFNMNDDNEHEYSIHCTYNTLIVYLKKPATIL